MTIKNISVVGAGTMGAGITQVCASAKYRVVLVDVGPSQIKRAKKSINDSLVRFARKGRLQEDVQNIIERVFFSTSMADCAEADLAIEAVFEDLSLKTSIFKELDGLVSRSTVMTTNTSAISITTLAAAVSSPERVVGIHFFNPVPMLKAVEVIRGLETSQQTMDAASAFVESLGKKPIRVHKDVPGFLLNRINLPSNLEAMRLVEQGIATTFDIDEGVKLAFGRPIGIFEVSDLVGLDVTLKACDAIYNETKDAKYLAPVILRRMVKAGRLGKKAGRGWYEYNRDGTRKDK